MRAAHTTLLVLLAIAGCGSAGAFACNDDPSCSGGTCQPSGYCSFPDGECASGQRYGAHAPADLADACVEDDDGEEVGETTGTAATSISTSSTSGVTASSTDTGEVSVGSEVSLSSTSADTSSTTDTGVDDFCMIEEFDDEVLEGWTVWMDEPVATVVADGAFTVVLPMIPGYAGLDPDTVGVANGTFDVQLREAPSQVSGTQVFLGIGTDSESYLLLLEEGMLVVRHDYIDGYENLFAVSWQPEDLFLRIRVEDGVLGFSRSNDGETYLPLGSAAPEFALDEAIRFLHAGTWELTADPGRAVFERVAVCKLVE